jgi:hypothetical protein
MDFSKFILMFDIVRYLASFEAVVRYKSQDDAMSTSFEVVDAEIDAAAAEDGLSRLLTGTQVPRLVVSVSHIRPVNYNRPQAEKIFQLSLN